MKKVKQILKKRPLILDGGTGTELQKRGLPQGVCPEQWCLENRPVIEKIHKDYRDAGADVVYTSTFGANKIKLGRYGISDSRKINKDLAVLARQSVDKGTIIAGDIGPTGKFVEPMGELLFEDAVNIFKEQAQGLIDGGVDIFVIETMMDIQEARAALIAIKEASKIFTIVTLTYEKDGRTLNGTDPVTAAVTLQSLGADSVGANCSVGPEKMADVILPFKSVSKVPIAAKPNAGMPKLIDGKTVFDMSPDKFAFFADKIVSNGASIIGGCCGTAPEHIKQLAIKVREKSPFLPSGKSLSALSSVSNHSIIKKDGRLKVIGEGINPTGKKKLRQDIKEGKFQVVRSVAKQQSDAGASFLDVNVSIPDIDEQEILKKVVSFLSIQSELPLVIDSSNPEAIEKALRIYPGRALVNSVSGEEEKSDKILPAVAKYGAMFIALPIDEGGITNDVDKRKKVIQKVFQKAEKLGLSKSDMIVDGLVMAVSASSGASLVTLQTISWANKEFGVNTVVGLSNISFGMPERELLNGAFLSMAQGYGLSLVIANPLHNYVMDAKRASDVLLQKDKDAEVFLNYYQQKKDLYKKIKKTENVPVKDRLYNVIVEGERDDIFDLVDACLKDGLGASYLLKEVMIPAITKAGDLFDKKEYFLPQLIASAETMEKGFKKLEPLLREKKGADDKQTVVILATVKGDIHDIGKNIVALMLKNYGFEIIDLGRDVPAERIIEEIKKHPDSVIGLSALMTTTMINMKDVISKAKESGLDCYFILGGAVVTEEFAKSLGVSYAQDGVSAVKVIKQIKQRGRHK